MAPYQHHNTHVREKGTTHTGEPGGYDGMKNIVRGAEEAVNGFSSALLVDSPI